MTFTASDIYSLFRPSYCERRVFLRAHGEPQAEPSDFAKLLEELGQRHEAEHLSSFPDCLDLREGTIRERIQATSRAVEQGVSVIYQGVLQFDLPGTNSNVTGVPDFLIKDGNGYKIRDCKLSKHADEDRHPEIPFQLQLYGWLFERNFRTAPTLLEVYLGDGSILPIPYDGGAASLDLIRQVHTLSHQPTEPFSPVGWSKCSGCGFRPRCWGMAEESSDVALVPDVDQASAIALAQIGVNSIEQLLQRFDEKGLSELRKPRGKQMVRVGKSAKRILQQAEALRHNRELFLSTPQIPASDNMVMFDLEGLPPYLDELDKIYLWGTQVFGIRPGKYLAGLADFGPDGDRRGWEQFLTNSGAILDDYGDIPFVHWSHYETTKVKGYINRHGDKDGIGQRVLTNCVDLLKLTKNSLILPEYSYSLKVIEKRSGFKRTMADYGGEWSIVQYIRAIETNDENLRNQIMSDILTYNQEDLQATWAVLEWLKTK